VASDLMAKSPRWKDAADHIQTVATQALQLWLNTSAPNLAPGATEGMVVGGYVEPHDTWADMPQLCQQELVPGAVTVAYFCNAFTHSQMPPRGQAAQWLIDQKALAYEEALRFLRHDIGPLWPNAVDPLTREFLWDLLVAPAGVQGEARLAHQYWRANVEPSEQYVQSVPGSSRYRIDPGDTGFANLYVAGDWTACGVNAGCVEAATISGLLAANAIFAKVGAPQRHIIGYHGP
jgi:uncharacterized protein with NAD-binding domain and iron-sulfur cluster